MPSAYPSLAVPSSKPFGLDRSWFDYLGLSATSLCLLHCLLFPLLAMVFSTGVFLSTGWLEYAFVFSAAVAVFFATRQARAQQVVLLLWAGLALLILGFAFGHDVQAGFSAINPIHVSAALCMGTGHVVNLRTARNSPRVDAAAIDTAAQAA